MKMADPSELVARDTGVIGISTEQSWVSVDISQMAKVRSREIVAIWVELPRQTTPLIASVWNLPIMTG
jgi:hypothetical protein